MKTFLLYKIYIWHGPANPPQNYFGQFGGQMHTLCLLVGLQQGAATLPDKIVQMKSLNPYFERKNLFEVNLPWDIIMGFFIGLTPLHSFSKLREEKKL